MARRLLAAASLVVAGALVIGSWNTPADAARAPGAVLAPGPVPIAGQALTSPVPEVRAMRLFVAPARPWLAGHRGIDLAAEVGSPLLAPGDGIVVFAGRVVDRGVVTVDHGGGLLSSLEPVSAPPAPGTAVARGDPLGTVTDAAHHCAPHACVHWGVRRDGHYVDPLDVLVGFGPVTLLPWPGPDGP